MTDFTDFLRMRGLIVRSPALDGRIHRVPTVTKPRKKNGAYRWMGDWGWAQCWDTMIEPAFWRADGPAKGAAARPLPDMKAMLAQERREAAEAADKARELVTGCVFDRHPYLERKGFPNERGLVHRDGRLVVPMRWFRNVNRLQSVQFIEADGAKRYLPGGAANEAVFIFGAPEAPETWMVEGLADGLAVRAGVLAMRRPARVMVCFSAGTMAKVGPQLLGQVYVVADHDRPNPQTGARAGEAAAAATGHRWAKPEREGDDPNDVYVRDGMPALLDLLRRAME
jgi:putative DNA primase/helicase